MSVIWLLLQEGERDKNHQLTEWTVHSLGWWSHWIGCRTTPERHLDPKSKRKQNTAWRRTSADQANKKGDAVCGEDLETHHPLLAMETNSDALLEFLVGGLGYHLTATSEYGVCRWCQDNSKLANLKKRYQTCSGHAQYCKEDEAAQQAEDSNSEKQTITSVEISSIPLSLKLRRNRQFSLLA